MTTEQTSPPRVSRRAAELLASGSVPTPASPDQSPPPPRRRGALGRAVAILTGVLVLALVALHLAGGWYFAGEIHRSGMLVDPAEVGLDLTVTETGRGSVTLEGPTAEAAPALDAGATYGLAWAKGYGQVTRGDRPGALDLKVLSGRPPRPGEPAGLDRWAFPDDPAAALGSPVRSVRYPTPLGPMRAWFAPGRGSTWAILVHGKGASRTEMLRMMRATVRAGLPSLAIEYRNDPGAPADSTGEYGYGVTEWQDLAAAVDYARSRGARRLVLGGASMGGAIVASYLFRSPDAPVDRVLLDSPMLDLGATVAHGARGRGLPLLGDALGGVPPSLTWAAQRLATLRYDVDWARTNYLTETAWVMAPTLVVHGTEDRTVPLATSEALAARVPDLVTLEAVEGADHVESWNLDPRGYERLLVDFLR